MAEFDENLNVDDEQTPILEDEDLETGVKGGSTSGTAGDIDEMEPLTPEDQDILYSDDEESEYSEFNDEEF